MADAETRDAFDRLAGGLAGPMLIVTVAAGEERGGCLVGFACQASIEPPRVIVCLSKRNRTYRLATVTDALAVHLVPDAAIELAELFGGVTGDEEDKLARCAWRSGPRGLPLLDECPGWFAGVVLERLDCGDHVAFLLEPFAASRGTGGRPMPYERVKDLEPGHEA